MHTRSDYGTQLCYASECLHTTGCMTSKGRQIHVHLTKGDERILKGQDAYRKNSHVCVCVCVCVCVVIRIKRREREFESDLSATSPSGGYTLGYALPTVWSYTSPQVYLKYLFFYVLCFLIIMLVLYIFALLPPSPFYFSIFKHESWRTSCLALRTRDGGLKNSFMARTELSPLNWLDSSMVACNTGRVYLA